MGFHDGFMCLFLGFENYLQTGMEHRYFPVCQFWKRERTSHVLLPVIWFRSAGGCMDSDMLYYYKPNFP